MKRKNRYLRTHFSTILGSTLAILLYATPVLPADVTVPANETWNIDYPVDGFLFVEANGTANLRTGASVTESIYVYTDGTLNMYSGTVGLFISVSPGASMTVYGTDFAVSNGTIQPDGSWTPEGGMGTLTGYYGDTSEINLLILSSTPIHLQPSDPETMLDELALFIQEKVASGEIDERLENPLLARVNAAKKVIQKNNLSAATQQLEHLVEFVDKRPDEKITPEAKAEIILRANAIIAALDS